MKIKKGSVAIYVLALMLVTAGYWNYISKESQTLETVSASQNNENTSEENLGDATLVNNNELIDEEESEETEEVKKEDGYFEESKLARDTMYSQTLETYQGMLNNSNVSVLGSFRKSKTDGKILFQSVFFIAIFKSKNI